MLGKPQEDDMHVKSTWVLSWNMNRLLNLGNWEMLEQTALSILFRV